MNMNSCYQSLLIDINTEVRLQHLSTFEYNNNTLHR